MSRLKHFRSHESDSLSLFKAGSSISRSALNSKILGDLVILFVGLDDVDAGCKDRRGSMIWLFCISESSNISG